MDTATPSDTLKIKKYPNRRFYDATRSRHVNLDDLHRLVRDGHRIEVTDSEGRDITNVVLTQILLEHDPPKLDLFPAALLHQALQANQQMVRRFIDEYFSKAMDLFLNSRKQFDAFLAQAGLSPLQPLSPMDWARKFLLGFENPSGSNVPTSEPEVPIPSGFRVPRSRDPAVEALRAEVEGLKGELARLGSRRSGGAGKSGRNAKRPKRRDAQRPKPGRRKPKR